MITTELVHAYVTEYLTALVREQYKANANGKPIQVIVSAATPKQHKAINKSTTHRLISVPIAEEFYRSIPVTFKSRGRAQRQSYIVRVEYHTQPNTLDFNASEFLLSAKVTQDKSIAIYNDAEHLASFPASNTDAANLAALFSIAPSIIELLDELQAKQHLLPNHATRVRRMIGAINGIATELKSIQSRR